MANVRVAVRVRPLSKRETKEGGKIIVEVDDKVAKIRNVKVDSRPESFGDTREKVAAFGFDYCYWSVDPEDPQYASQEVVFQDLGTEVLSGAAKGYNICLFAYGQTGSGKTYTMLGTPASVGLTPRICEGLFMGEDNSASLPSSRSIKVSFLEIYNERVRDLLKQSNQNKSYTLRVREHPEMGPYVQGLSQHVVTNYQQVIQLLEEGIANRMTAATHVHEASSRSHAIFTIHCTQAVLQNNLPSETASKINLVDLAGSERADPSYCKDRITEGANINKSLVTLGIVISTLAQNSQVFSSCQSLSSAASSGGDSGIPSTASGSSSGGGPARRQSYIPYRDSVLTWLLKESLGGNSRTIMVATVSPAHTSYSETLSTMRYASTAKNVINKPRVNEDANVKLIRELREEIDRLKALLLNFELRNFPSLNDLDESLKELVLQNDLKIEKLTQDRTQKWSDWQALMEHYGVDINRKRAGVVIESSLPHLMALEDDVLSTGVVLYHLKEGTTKIGRIDSDQEQDIVLQGQWIERDHCTITSTCGVVILQPTQGARCTVNGREVTASCRLTQGAIIMLGKAQKFRFNHPAEAALLRHRRLKVAEALGSSSSLEWLDLDGDVTASRLGLCPVLWKERRALEERCDKDQHPSGEGKRPHRAQTEQQQCCVEDLKQRVTEGQGGGQKELEVARTPSSRQRKDNQQWLLREETWLASLQETQREDSCEEEKELEAFVAPDACFPKAPQPPPSLLVQSQKRVVQLQRLQRRASRAPVWNVRRKKVSFQLERVKKRRLLEAQRRLERYRALYCTQDDGASKAPGLVSISDISGPGPQCRSRRATHSSLTLQRLCSQRPPQLHSGLMNRDPSTMSPPVPDPTHQGPEKTLSADTLPRASAYTPRTECLGRNGLHSSGWRKFFPTRGASTRRRVSTPGTCLTESRKSLNRQETESLGREPCQMSSQSLVTLCQSTKKLKPRDGSRTLPPAAQPRRAKGSAASGSTQTGWPKAGSCGTYKAPKETASDSYLSGSEEAAGHRKVGKTFQAGAKPPPPSRASKKHQRVLAARVRDVARKVSHLPYGSSLKKQLSAWDPDTLASSTGSRPTVDCVKKKDNDLSDTESSYSVDSLSYVYAKVPRELPKPRGLQGNWDPQDPEGSESDNSQLSEDSLVEKGFQSPPKNSGGEYSTKDRGHSRARTSASVKGLSRPSDSSLCTQSHRSFSLDSPIDADELRGDRQEEPCLGSADEAPTETFWHLQKAALPVVDQEATHRPSPLSHRTGVGVNVFLPKSQSFYLNPHFQPYCEQAESEMEASYSKQTNSLQGVELARESPLASVDSWFSCDSKVNPSSPSGIVHTLCLIPDLHELQPHGEKPRHWLNIEEVKPPGTVLPCSPRGSPEPSCSSDLYAASAADTSKPSACGCQKLLQPGADGAFQGRDVPDLTYQAVSEESHSSEMLSVPAPSATSVTHVGSIHEKDWAALQQKYLLDLSNSVLEAVGEPRPALPFLEEDSSFLAEASDQVDTQLPVGPGVCRNLTFSHFSVHLSKARPLEAEEDHDNPWADLECASDLDSTIERVSYSGACPADLEPLASGFINAQACTAGNKAPDSMTEAWRVNRAGLEGRLQSGRNPGLMTSSGQHFFQKRTCHSHHHSATEVDPWPQDGALLRKNTAGLPGLVSQHPLLEEKAAPFQSSLQPPALEMFYVTKSRDALTETALEIPACREAWVPSPPPREAWVPSPSPREAWVLSPPLREAWVLSPPPREAWVPSPPPREAWVPSPPPREAWVLSPPPREAWVPSPPPREAWGCGHSYQVLQKAHWKSNLPKLLQSQNSKIDSSEQATTKKPTDLDPGEGPEELEDCSRNVREEEDHDPAYSFVAGNRHHLPPTSLKACECRNQLGILNKKHSLSVHEEGEGASSWCHCSVAFDGSESKTLFFICDSKASLEEQSEPLLQRQACGVPSQTSGVRSDFIGKITNFDLDKGVPEETAVSLKPRSLHCRASSPVTTAGGGSPTHKWEGRKETTLLREVISKDIRGEFSLPGAQYTCERCHHVLCSQERKPSECKAHGQSQEMKSKEEPLEETRSKGANSANEMARLIRSVMQLETGILEMESRQNKGLHASHMPGTEFMLQDLQDQERPDHVLMPGSSGEHLFFEDQPSSPVQVEDGTGDSKAREVEGNSAVGNDAQAQKLLGCPCRPRECAQMRQSGREHSYPPPEDRLARDPCDSVCKGVAIREPSSISLHSRRRKALARTLPLQPSTARSPELDDELLKATANFQDQAWALESFKEPETLESFQESQLVELAGDSKVQGAKAQGRAGEMTVKRGGSLQEEESTVLSTQKRPAPSQHCKGAFFSQQAISAFHNQTGFSAAQPYGGWSGTQPMQSPSLPRGCLHASDTEDISSLEHMLEPTMVEITRSCLTTGVGHQDHSGETRSCSPQGSAAEEASITHTAWCGSVMPMAMRSNGQSVIPDSILLEAEDWVTVSISPKGDQKGDLRVTSTGLTTQEGLGSEAEATVQKEIKTSSLDRVSGQTEKRASFLLQKDSDQGEGQRQKAEETSGDQQSASSARLTPMSGLRAPEPEPLPLLDSSAHASICLAILAEIRQAKAQRTKLSDFATEQTVLPSEPSREATCLSEAAGRSEKQVVKLGSGTSRHELEAQRLHMASPPPCAPVDLLADERKAQAITGSFHHLPNPETDRGPGHHLLPSSHTVSDLDTRCGTGETRQFWGASRWPDSSEVKEEKKETSRTLSSVYPLASDRLLSAPPVEQDMRVGSERVSVLPSQTCCDEPGGTLHRQSQLAARETAEGISFSGQDRIPEEHQEPGSLDSTRGGGLAESSETSQEGKAVCAECQPVVCGAGNAAGLSRPKQDRVHHLDTSTGLEETKASPKPCAAQPSVPRKVEAEAHVWRPVNWKNVGSGLAEACGADSKYTRSTPLLDQRPSLHPSAVREEAPGLCPEESLVFKGSTGDSRTFDTSYEEEEDRTVPCPQLGGSQPAVHPYCSPPSALPCCRDGVPRRGTPSAAPHPVCSPFIVPSRAHEVDRTIESFPKETRVFLERGLKHQHANGDVGPADSRIPTPTTTAAVSSPAYSCSSLSTSEARADCLTHTVAGGRSVEGAGEETSGRKASIIPEDASPSSPAGTHSEPLSTLKDNSEGENAQAAQAVAEPPAVPRGPQARHLNEGSVGGELLTAAQSGHLENTIRCCSENTQPSAEVSSHIVDMLKHPCQPQVETLWEEEEQQRDQALEGGQDHAQVRHLGPSDKDGFDGSQSRAGEREEMVVTKSSVSQTFFSDFEDLASLPLGQTEPSQPVSQTPSQLCSGKEHPAPRPRHALPVIAVFPGPKTTSYSPRTQFSVVSSSRSLHKLNLSVEPSSPTDEDAQGPNRLWGPHLRGHSSEKPVSVSPKTQDCSPKASCNSNSSPIGHKPLRPVIPPYPTSTTVSCMPTPDLMTNWMPGTLEQAHQGKPDKLSVQGMPENCHSQVDKEMLHFGSSDISPYVLPWCPQGPVHIGWKQYVFGSAVDVPCSQKPQCLMPSDMACCPGTDNALEDKRSPFHSHLRTYAQTRDLSNIHSSIENDQSSNKGWEIWSSSLAVREPCVLFGSEGVAPTLGSAKKPPSKGPSEEIGFLRSELPLAGRSAAAQADEIVLPCPSETGCAARQARTSASEQGTHCLGCRLHSSCTDISAQTNASTMSDSELASWTSMHNLSLHLSQLLHSTSELLGSLSKPSVVPKEQKIKNESPDEAPQAVTMDGSTQTTVDEAIQTDLALPPLPFQAPEVKPQKVSVILEVIDSGIATMTQKRGASPVLFQKSEADETTEAQDLRDRSTHYKLQSPPVPSPHLSFQKAHLGQGLTFVSPPASPDGSPPPSLQPEEPCMVVSSPGMSHHSGEFTQEPSTQKKVGPSSAALVDRASSPILTFSASTHELSNPLDSCALSVPSAYPPEDFQKVDIGSDLAVSDPRPPMDNSQASDKSSVSQKAESLDREGKSSLESSKRLSLDPSSPCGQQQSSSVHISFFGQVPQQPQPKSTTGDQSRLPSPPPRHRSSKLGGSFVPEKVASIEHGPPSSRRPSQWQGRAANENESPAFIVEPQASVEQLSSRRGLQPLRPCPLSFTTGLQNPAVEPPQACQPVGLLCPGSHILVTPGPQHHSLRDLPVHNKLNNWYGVQDGPGGRLHVSEDLGVGCDSSSVDPTQRPLQPSDNDSQDPEWLGLKHIPLQVGAQKPSLSVELAEAKLHHGFGETDALLKVLQSGTGHVLAPEEPAVLSWEEHRTRQEKSVETLRSDRTARLYNFRRTRSLSPQKQPSFLPSKDLPTWKRDLPSRRREYLQQLRKDVVATTRIPEPASRSAHPPSHIDLMLRDYLQAREEAKLEIAQARDRLRERTEQEKKRIRQQIISQLLKEEEKLQTLAHSSSLCTSSNGSISSGVTSGYNSSPAFPGHLQSLEVVEDSQVPEFRDTWIGDWRVLSTVRNSHLYLTGPTWKSLAHSRRASPGSSCCSLSGLSSLGTCFSSSYQDLAKHIINTSMADVMAACSDDLHNLFSRQATAGWNYQGEEQEVQLYYKEFSSTRHGFLGAGVVSQPLSHVWAAVSDPTLWPLYHKPIQTARLHQRVTNTISLVYLVCDTTLCALKQLRDFCCVCVEAKEGHLSIMAAQSVYDTSMPRPSRKIVRGEILPSAWVLQPVITEGKEITRVIFLAQVELGAPGFPPHLLNSFIKQQPLVVAKLASFLGS